MVKVPGGTRLLHLLNVGKAVQDTLVLGVAVCL